MKNEDLSYLIEEYGIQLYRAHKLLKGKSLVHCSEDKSTKPERIVFKATLGERRLDGIPGAFTVELRATYYSSTDKTSRRNLIRKAMVEAMYETVSTRPVVPVFANLTDLILEDEMSSETENADNHREFTLVFPFIAKQKSTLIAA